MYELIVMLVVLILSAVLSMALRPRPKTPNPATQPQPTTKDGRALRRAFGTNWIDDASVVGWANGSPEPIKSGGGKK